MPIKTHNLMSKNKLITFEKILFLGVLLSSLWGFWVFEENLTLKIMAIFLATISIVLAVRNSDKQASSKFELTALLILYLGIFSLYNLLYSVNLPLYLVMIVILILVVALVFSVLSLDQVYGLIKKEVSNTFILLNGLVILEVFLSLYFWPIDPEVKSLVIVLFFYLILTLIYLHIHSMLRLKRVAGYLIVSLIILISIMLISWLRLTR